MVIVTRTSDVALEVEGDKKQLKMLTQQFLVIHRMKRKRRREAGGQDGSQVSAVWDQVWVGHLL